MLERLPVAANQVDKGLQERPRDRLPDQILRAVQGPLQVGRHVARERRQVVEGGVHFLRVVTCQISDYTLIRNIRQGLQVSMVTQPLTNT